MKRVRCALVVAIALVLTTAATASSQQLADLFSVSAGIGVDVPIGNFADKGESGGSATTGFDGGVGFERMIGESFGLGASVRYTRFGANTEIVGVDGNYHTFLLDVSGRFLFMPGSATRPFVTAGIMVGKPKLTLEAGGDEGSATFDMVFGFHVGGGVLHMINPTTGIFGAITLNDLATDGEETTIEANGVEQGKVKATFNMQWIAIRGGVTIFLWEENEARSFLRLMEADGIGGAGAHAAGGLLDGGSASLARFEYTVNTSVGLTAGVGVLIPASKLLAIIFEPRYRLISTKGAGYDELRVYHDGSSETFLQDQGGNRLRQKSNTTWWELRGGLVLTIR